jgi:Alginate export
VNTPAPATGATSSKTPTDNLLLVNRAWGLWKANESLSFRIGRFGITVADGAVFAENDWQPVPTAHEGLEAVVDTDMAKLSVYFLKTNELLMAPTGEIGDPSSDPERNLYMISGDLKNLPDAIKTANLHFVLANRDQTKTTTPAAVIGSQLLQHIGLTLGGDISGFIYKATGAYQSGFYSKSSTLDQKLNAYMVDALVGYANSEAANIRVTAGYHMDSGNKSDFVAATSDSYERYQTLYYERHDYAGLLDLLGWGNLSYWNAEASFYPAEDFEMGSRFFMFSQTEGGDPEGLKFGPRHLSLTAGAPGDKSLGTEVDAYGTKYYDGGYKVQARLSGFFPGAYFKNGTPSRDKPIVQAMFQGAFEF